jgi:hypothetical protein
MDQHPYFQVSFRPNVKLVSTVRRFTEEFYQRTMDYELSEKVALATHELLENAVSYASDGETGVRIEVVDNKLMVRTWNRTSPDHLADLIARIDEMNRSDDPDEYYQMMLHQTAYRAEGSGLGLARIRAEAEMSISYEVVLDQLHIKASAPLKPVVPR